MSTWHKCDGPGCEEMHEVKPDHGMDWIVGILGFMDQFEDDDDGGEAPGIEQQQIGPFIIQREKQREPRKYEGEFHSMDCYLRWANQMAVMLNVENTVLKNP